MASDCQRTGQDVVDGLGSHSSRGLTTTEARTRLERDGPNQLAVEAPRPAWRKFLAQFRDVLVILLLVAMATSVALWLYERDAPLPYEAIAIGAVVLLNALVGYLQQQRAESAIAALQQMAAAHGHVIRDGAATSIPAAEVVSGDILVVEEGRDLSRDEATKIPGQKVLDERRTSIGRNVLHVTQFVHAYCWCPRSAAEPHSVAR